MSSTLWKVPSDIAPNRRDFLLYDGECPFCAAFVKMQRMRAAGVNLQLIDARQEPQLVADFVQYGVDINEGMIMRVGDMIYFGGDVLHVVALMTGPTGSFNRALGNVFASRLVTSFVYPALRTGRNITLVLLGLKKIMHER